LELIEEVTIRDFLFGFYEQKGNNSIQVNAYVISKAPNLLTKPGNQVPNELQRGEYLEKLFEKDGIDLSLPHASPKLVRNW